MFGLCSRYTQPKLHHFINVSSKPSIMNRGSRTGVTGALFFFTVTLLDRAGREPDNHSPTLASAVQKCVGNYSRNFSL